MATKFSQMLLIFIASITLGCIAIAIASKHTQGVTMIGQKDSPALNQTSMPYITSKTYTNLLRQFTITFRDPWQIHEAPSGFPVLIQNPMTESTIMISDQCLQTLTDYTNELDRKPEAESRTVAGLQATQFQYRVARGAFQNQTRMMEINFDAPHSHYCIWATISPAEYSADFIEAQDIINSISFP